MEEASVPSELGRYGGKEKEQEQERHVAADGQGQEGGGVDRTVSSADDGSLLATLLGEGAEAGTGERGEWEGQRARECTCLFFNWDVMYYIRYTNAD